MMPFMSFANGFFSSCQGDTKSRFAKAAPPWQSAAKKGWGFPLLSQRLTTIAAMISYNSTPIN